VCEIQTGHTCGSLGLCQELNHDSLVILPHHYIDYAIWHCKRSGLVQLKCTASSILQVQLIIKSVILWHVTGWHRELVITCWVVGETREATWTFGTNSGRMAHPEQEIGGTRPCHTCQVVLLLLHCSYSVAEWMLHLDMIMRGGESKEYVHT
jgi:hypothetical protein